MTDAAPPMSGRRAQAARNDAAVLAAAREVLVESPGAPMSAVARAAGVGMSAVYKRFGSKEEMIARICEDGLRQYVEVARGALGHEDPGESFTQFFHGIVDAEVHALLAQLAGRFDPPDRLGPLVAEADRLTRRLLEDAQVAGVVRDDLEVNDLTILFEQINAVRLGDRERTHALRDRYLALHLDALRPGAPGRLPGPPPSDAELGARWRRRPDRSG